MFDGDQGADRQFEAKSDRHDNAADSTDKVKNRVVVDEDENGKEGTEYSTLESDTMQQQHFLREQQNAVNWCYNK